MKTETTADTYHHGDLANSLLRAVEDIVLERGPTNLSLREAARRAGVSHSAPAHHFGDKEGMLAAFAQEGFEGLVAEMQGIEDSDDPVATMNAMGAAYVRFAVAHPAHYDVMFRSGPDKAAYPALHEAAGAAFQGLLHKVGRLKAAGFYPAVPEHVLAAYFWSMVHGLASLWIDGSLSAMFDEADLERLVADVLAISSAPLASKALD